MKNFLLWLSRIAGILSVIYIGARAIYGHYAWPTFAGFDYYRFPSLVLMIILLLVVVIAWQWEKLGGFLFLCYGFVTSQVLFDYTYLGITAFVGLLFIVSGYINSKLWRVEAISLKWMTIFGISGFIFCLLGYIAKWVIPNIPDVLIGVPVPMAGLFLLPIGGVLFGLIGGLASHMLLKTKMAGVIGSIVVGIIFNLVITPLPQ